MSFVLRSTAVRISENFVDYFQGNWGRVREFHGLKLLINLTKYLARSLENFSKLNDCNYVPVSDLLMQFYKIASFSSYVMGTRGLFICENIDRFCPTLPGQRFCSVYMKLAAPFVKAAMGHVTLFSCLWHLSLAVNHQLPRKPG